MYKKKLCLAILSASVSDEEQLSCMKAAGFDGFFDMWEPARNEKEREIADRLGLLFQSIHAPYGNAARMWRGGDGEATATEELLACIDTAAALSVPLVVLHPYIGFEDKADVTASGLHAFSRVVDRAAEKGVRVAFENVEGEEYLAALMKEFRNAPHVGFCWDTGHEQCYNRGKDMTALYGDRIFGTHLNDNLGVHDFSGSITFLDDLHLLPFDGITDWDSVAERLCRYGFDGPLTFELNLGSKPERFDNVKYAKLPLAEYIAEAYARACRVAALLLRREAAKRN